METGRPPRGPAALLGALSPRRRRWLRFLHRLPLDPDELEAPVAPPGPRDFIICGCPRTGTSLLAASLFQPPSVITVMEPWDGMRLPPADLFRSIRREVARTGQLRRGRLDLVALQETGSVRWCRDGATPVNLHLDPDHLLGVKWPAFWRYLQLLPDTKFLVCLRHPLEVVGSFRRAGGRLAEGLDYDTRFNRRMNEALRAATDDPALRRVLLFDYVHRRILPHLDAPNVQVVRYERWFEDPEGLLGEVGGFLGARLGPPPVRIHPPEPGPRLDPEERRLIERHLTIAAPLGYPL